MRSGILPFFIMGEFFLYSDESGDLGLNLASGGTTRTYVPFVLVIDPDFRDPFYLALKTSFKKITGESIRHWKDISGSIKNNDEALCSVIRNFEAEIERINPQRRMHYLFSASVLDKSEVNKMPSSHLFMDRTFRMAWSYGLIFKRLGIYLEKMGHTAVWKIHQNADPEIKNLKRYINNHIPQSENFIKRYTGPIFTSEEEKRSLKAADFFAGLTRVLAEDIITNCDECFLKDGNCLDHCVLLTYPNLIKSFYPLFNTNLIRAGKTSWKWRGFFYHPANSRAKYSHAFPADEFFK